MTFKSLACAAASMLILAGCHQTTPPAPSSPPPVALPAAGGVQIQLKVSPEPPRQLDTATFTVIAGNERGEPLRDATVNVDLTMPSMEMPKNEIVCRQTKPGEYSGTGRFTMAGDWQARVTAQGGKQSGVRSFPITVK
ncbi:MAG: FixH family protein [Capsulimonas sp.]|uniref:FixH family protein n=1 Tax=Capsulimonas sp. TaxID=2494211 RepID=UPI0032655A75